MSIYCPSLVFRHGKSVLYKSSRSMFFFSSKQELNRTWLEKLQNFEISEESLKKYTDEQRWKYTLRDQRYIKERHHILGPDLATSHFVVKRKGAVKFKGVDNWVQMDEKGNYDLPPKYVPNLFLEAIDVSGTVLLYEGLVNFVNLDHLKYLNLSKCPYVTDHFLASLHRFRKTLLYLDVSMCPQVTHNGLATLHHLKNLKRLVMKKMPSVEHPELMALMIEEALPECIVEGVDYTDTEKLSSLETTNDLDDGLENIHSISTSYNHQRPNTITTAAK